MSIGKLRKKENPRVLKPLPTPNASEKAPAGKISTADQIKAQKFKERQEKQKQKQEAMLAIKNEMKSLLEGA